MIDTDQETAEVDVAESDAAGVDMNESDTAESQVEDATPDEAEKQDRRKRRGRRQVSISLRSLAVAITAAVLVVAVGVLAWLYVGAERKYDDQARRADNSAHAERVALDYAVGAAEMNYQDLNAWKVKLVAGTSPELKDKLTKAATSMEQILVPLEWSSSARPLAAKVRSVTGGIYIVDSFVSVHTKTMQAPEALQSTATYSVTIDSGKDWQISDVGGVGDALEPK